MKRINISLKEIKKKYYSENKSQEQIAKEFNVSQWVISQRMKEQKLKTKSKTRNLGKKKYSVNEYLFDKITPLSAWILGWLVSDGYIANNRITLHLAQKDIDVLIKIKHYMEYTGPIYKQNATLNNKIFKQASLSISSKRLCKKLLQYGIVSPKTNKEVFPKVIIKSNKENKKAFIRGIFEGDGSILIDKNKSVLFQIVGTKQLLEEIQLILMKILHVPKTKLTKNSKRNHYALRYRGKKNVFKILNWVYNKHNNFLMNRKYIKFYEIKGSLT